MTDAVKLEKFTNDEKAMLTSILRKRLFLTGAIYMTVIILAIAFLVYFNKFSENYNIQNNLEVINVVSIIISVLFARLFVSEWMDYRKEINSSDKKIILTKILAKKNGEVTLGNKSFDEDDFIFGAVDFNSLQSGDNVEIEISAKSDTLFRIKRI